MLREAGIPGFRAGKIPALTNPVHSHQPEWAEKAVAPHSSTLVWQIPWTEEPGRLQSMASLGVRHDWATSLSLFTFMHWKRKWQPTPVFLPGESQGWGAWWAAVYGVAQSRTLLKRLSSSSSSGSRMRSLHRRSYFTSKLLLVCLVIEQTAGQWEALLQRKAPAKLMASLAVNWNLSLMTSQAICN